MSKSRLEPINVKGLLVNDRTRWRGTRKLRREQWGNDTPYQHNRKHNSPHNSIEKSGNVDLMGLLGSGGKRWSGEAKKKTFLVIFPSDSCDLEVLPCNTDVFVLDAGRLVGVIGRC